MLSKNTLIFMALITAALGSNSTPTFDLKIFLAKPEGLDHIIVPIKEEYLYFPVSKKYACIILYMKIDEIAADCIEILKKNLPAHSQLTDLQLSTKKQPLIIKNHDISFLVENSSDFFKAIDSLAKFPEPNEPQEKCKETPSDKFSDKN